MQFLLYCFDGSNVSSMRSNNVSANAWDSKCSILDSGFSYHMLTMYINKYAKYICIYFSNVALFRGCILSSLESSYSSLETGDFASSGISTTSSDDEQAAAAAAAAASGIKGTPLPPGK